MDGHPVITEAPRSPRRARGALARLGLLAGLLAFGVANAADVEATYIDGGLQVPQVFAGTGYHSIGLKNDSDQAVEFTLARLHDGYTVAQYKDADDALQAAIPTGGDAEVAAIKTYMDAAAALGGTVVKPHESVDMLADLESGTYVVTAIPSSEGQASGEPTYMSFEVTESGPAAEAPDVDHVLHFADFSFDVPATLSAGENLWEVSNVGEQPHIATFFKLMPGKTADDVKAFLSGSTDQSGPPPFDPTTEIDIEAVTPGQTVYLPLDFTSGDWVAVCFVTDLDHPDMTHFMEGMIEAFTVS